jgi:HPr kinase/phosphorylase
VDVFGVGILITGSSGIGKSECALDLVERGHGSLRRPGEDYLHNNTLVGSAAKERLVHGNTRRGYR